MKNNIDVLSLKEMMQSKRSTGRTRRMVFEAARLVFLEGRTVVIVAKTNQSVREIEFIVKKYFNHDISTNIIVDTVDGYRDTIKVLSDKPEILHDHFCFEQELLELMEKYTRFDN